MSDTNDRFPYGNWDTAQNIVTALICWRYVCNNLSGDGVSFQEASEAVAFLAGHCIADQWHEEKQQQEENDAMHKAAAEEGDDAIQLSVAT